MVKTSISKDSTDSDMRASYRLLAESVNEIRAEQGRMQVEQGRMQGRMEAAQMLGSVHAEASAAESPGNEGLAPMDAGARFEMGAIDIHGAPPASAAEMGAAPAKPSSKPLPLDLDSALGAAR